MRKLLLAFAVTASLAAGSVLAAGDVKAEAAPQLIFGVDRADEAPTLDRVQFIYLGRNYCWYDGGWHGPGFYWCGYAWRRGYGWGGGSGWRGWAGHPGWNGWRGGAWHGRAWAGRGHWRHDGRRWRR
jgi:hypothetical protein